MAKAVESVLDPIDNGFRECNICFENVGQKKVLQCGHDFCIPCLERIFHEISSKSPRSAAEIRVPCPECRQDSALSRNSGTATLPNRFFGNLKCGFCQIDKPTDEMWWCPACVKILCSKCDVKEHRRLRHEVFEWNSLQGVKDCCTLLRGNRKLEQDLKDFFGKVTSEILASLNATSEKTEIAALLANTYGIENFPTLEAAQNLWHDSDKSFETLSVVQRAFSLADIDMPPALLAPSAGEQTVHNIISTVSPKSVADSILSGAISMNSPSENWSVSTDRPSLVHIDAPEASSQPPLGRRPIRPTAPPAAEVDFPFESSPSVAPPTFEHPTNLVERMTGMTLSYSMSLNRLPEEFSGFRSDSGGKFFAIFDPNVISAYRRSSEAAHSWQFTDSMNIRSGIIDAFIADSQQLYILSYSGAVGLSLFGYTVENGAFSQFFSDILELKPEAETKICAVSSGTSVYIAQKDGTCARTTVVYKYTTGGMLGALSWLQKMLLYPVAKIPDDSNLGDLLSVAVARTGGERYTDVIAIGFESKIVVLQVSEYRVLMKQKEFSGSGQCLSFSPMGWDSVNLRIKKSDMLTSKKLYFTKEMVQGSGGQREKVNRITWTGEFRESQLPGATFDPEGFRNSLIFGRNNENLGFLARLNLHGTCIDVFEVGEATNIDTGDYSEQRPVCNVM